MDFMSAGTDKGSPCTEVAVGRRTSMGVSKYFNDVGCKHYLINLLHERVSSIWLLFWNDSGPQSCNSIEASENWV